MRKRLSNWWKNVTWTSTWTGAKQVGRRSWSTTKGIPWRYILSFAWLAPTLEKLVSIVLKLGTLLLVVLFLAFFLRLFKDQGYIIQEFSVPKQLEEQGYTGEVMALRLQDKVLELKELAGSVKADSLQLNSSNDDIDLSVLGVGLSLRTLAFQMREALGRENQTLRGEVTRIGNRYEAQVRMSDFPKITSVVFAESEEEAEALDRLFKEIAEGILFHTDPYRLALLMRKEDRQEEAIATIRHILRTNDREAHWAYLAWGSMLAELDQDQEAIEKFKKAIDLKPDFSLAYVNIGYAYLRQDRVEQAISNMRKAAMMEPDNIERQSSLAWMLHNNGFSSGADSLFEKVLSRNDIDDEYRQGLALSWAEMRFHREDINGAKEILDTHVHNEGENVFSYLIKGVTAFSNQDTTLALEYFKGAYDLDPSSEAAINASTGFAQMVGDYEHVLHVYHTADWSAVNQYQVINAYNQIAMYFNQVEEHDSARVVVDRAIAIDTTMGYPYTTLAETLHFQGYPDSFYYYTEKALQLGFDIDFYDDEPPYDYYHTQLQFQQLLDKYRKKEDTFSD